MAGTWQRSLRDSVGLLWRTSMGSFVLAIVGIALGVLSLFKDPLAAAIVFAALLIALTTLGVYSLVIRTKLGDPFEVVAGTDHWEIADRTGNLAVITRDRELRALHDNLNSFFDYARGEGVISNAYGCAPYHAVDHYTEAGWRISLISLRRSKKRGDVFKVSTKRDYKDAFLNDSEYVNVRIAYVTHDQTLRIHFPADRPPSNVKLATSENMSQTTDLQPRGLPDGRQRVEIALRSPKRGHTYTVQWDW